MTVQNNANWTSGRTYGRIGVRNNMYSSDHNDYATPSGAANGSASFISGITGNNTVNFVKAYSGDTIPSGKIVVESYDGGTYPYPISKGDLPTDNTWKYVEGYFGSANTLWDGASNVGWIASPAKATKIILYLNLYTNTGTVPIKYADIRI